MSETVEVTVTQDGATAEAAPQPDQVANTNPVTGQDTTADAHDTTEQTAPEDGGASGAHAPAETEEQKRIARAAYEARQARRQVRALEDEIAVLKAAQKSSTEPQQPDAQPKQPSQAEIDRQIEARAAELARQKEFNAQADAIYEKGVAEIGRDFNVAIGAFREIGGLPPALVETAAETGEAHKLLHYLGKNLDEAERLLALPPHRMGAAAAKIVAKITAPPPAKPVLVSKAPPPIAVVEAKATRAAPDPERMTMDEYVAWRAASKRKSS